MRDFEECRKAVASGDELAQFDLGDMYSPGARRCKGGKEK